ncbi:sensor histidine kinase [Kribbella solani]|uniref:histidine kinase n=1 Tax=Kribbella solani TaxID=236067 RepID=A0A841DLQ3_9ACTN|nr:sensor histidine kinase [Kribbella solani]MBB5977706.1 signal transduction histidine kinase [Kribbella solani]MDX2971206.1 sensor histidine kinase [Kribbella solani]MDX3002016.1 sensor histidine kinase [Kribbella solani]
MSSSDPIEIVVLGDRTRRVLRSVILSLISVIGTLGSAQGQPERRHPDVLMVVLLLIGTIALYWLRTHPVAVLWTTATTTLIYMLREYPWGPVVIAFVIAVFTVIRLGHRLAGWAGLIALYVGHVGGRIILGINADGVYQVLLVGACFCVLGFLAELFRAHRDRVMAATKTRREEELRRAGEERLRIAQELHDVVAHHISLINVQASTALHLSDRQPEQAIPALAAIKDASKEALVELRSIVGVLRQSGESAPRQPVAGLDHLDHLVTRTGRAGLEVHKIIHGNPRPLPTGLDRAAFRIIQESLTNVVRHAKATSATVRVQYGEQALVLQIDDNGDSVTAQPIEGNGISGMRERATALGGTLTANRTPAGGFRITATLPL